MNEIERAEFLLEEAGKWIRRAREQAAYQDKLLEAATLQADEQRRRAQKAEAELNNIRQWARTPTPAESLGLNALAAYGSTPVSQSNRAAAAMVANAAATDREARIERNESGMP